MLDTETRRRIDTARDILVGKVPDPKSQVEQITIALIYKFMDDMDAEAEELGGKRKFFAGEFARYGWAKLMRSGLGGHETLNLYAEGITRMPENPGIPLLFRNIFKNAYLPYRDPETLRSFLKVIDEFVYDHSERLGDAFEYLLSVLGSQGDAGQFRTPRHIIDFMVAIVDPKKDETILDPACGTAGFLISSYKHILKNNVDEKGVSTLTPDDRGRLARNFSGYDISPDMVRLSLVNMYLHGFVDPHIFEYDTLTSLDRWNEFADVILANPPFMSPKGGIRPHNRFSVQSKRSEVLFVDYIAEHLTPSGRAGVIVPEGIIFQSGTAYKRLRKKLLEESLVAVISLPSGVFQPYSGVKTSILILDKNLARKSASIAFFKVENDGFDLGAQRRPMDKNDLPVVLKGIKGYLTTPEQTESGPLLEDLKQKGICLVVPREKIASNGEFNLSGERYRENGIRVSKYSFVPLGKVTQVISGQSPPGESYNIVSEGMPFYQGKTDFGKIFLGPPSKWTTNPKKIAETGDILISVRAPVGPVNISTQKVCIGRGLAAIRPNKELLDPIYVFYCLRSLEKEITGDQGAAFASISQSQINGIQIPLPPLEVQKEIVAEIEGYQKVIDGARAVVENYRPHIPIDPAWPMVELGDLCTIERGASPRPIHKFLTDEPGGVNWIKIGDAEVGGKYITSTKERVTPTGAAKSRRVKPGDFILSNSMSFGRPYIMATEGCIHDGWLLLLDFSDLLDKDFLYHVLGSSLVYKQFRQCATGGVVNNLNSEIVRGVKIPLPSLVSQRKIVVEIETEQALVNANRELISRMGKKIQDVINRVWGEGN